MVKIKKSLNSIKESAEYSKERKKETNKAKARKALLREKMKLEGLKEGSGVPGKDLSSYDQDEIWELIQATRCLSNMPARQSKIKAKVPNKKNH